MASDGDDDDDVGYGKPPRATRFKPGKSGNPRGRAKGLRGLKTEVKEEMLELIGLRVGEKVKRITKQRAIVKALFAKGLHGDVRAGLAILALIAKLFEGQEEKTQDDEPAPEDRAILNEYIDELLQKRSRK